MKNMIKRIWWIPVFYLLILAAVWARKEYGLEVDTPSLLLILLVLLPLILPRLASLEYGGMKVELRELRNEVVETKQEVKKEVSDVREAYRQMSDRLAAMAERSADYLKPQPLSVSDQKATELRETINLSDEDVEAGLWSLDPNLRIPAYIELQVRPRRRLFAVLLDAVWLEQIHARRRLETRPLWQILVAINKALLKFGELSTEETERTLLVLRHLLEFLRSDERIDPGKQCETRTQKLLGMVSDKSTT